MEREGRRIGKRGREGKDENPMKEGGRQGMGGEVREWEGRDLPSCQPPHIPFDHTNIHALILLKPVAQLEGQ